MRNETVNLLNMLKERQEIWLNEDILTKVQIEDLDKISKSPFQLNQPYLFMSAV